ncbi:hypothetical protein FOZ63_030554 [Perkinsus olseni]|uniref:Uncharacterized protein n=1 Tax=Perkinsus olseni TaxID=32597 RepID=A0A7J6RND9_PEROL|nr:hypothetical protein FOZ63_030554 [Perkinsus olseni]
MSETVSTGGVMTRAKVAVVEKEKAEEPQRDVGGENDHKQEEVEKAETVEEGHEEADKKDVLREFAIDSVVLVWQAQRFRK